MKTENLIIEHLRAIRGDLASLSERVGFIESDMGSLKSDMATMLGRYFSLDARVGRIEKRLGIINGMEDV